MLPEYGPSLRPLSRRLVALRPLLGGGTDKPEPGGTTIPTMTDYNAAQVLDGDHHHPDFAAHGYHPQFWEEFHPRTARIARTAAALDREISAAARQVPDTHPLWQCDRHEDAAAALQAAETISRLLAATIRDANRRIFQVAPPEYRAEIYEAAERARGKLQNPRHYAQGRYDPNP